MALADEDEKGQKKKMKKSQLAIFKANEKKNSYPKATH